MKTVTRQGSRRGGRSTPRTRSRRRGDACAGFARPKNASRMKARTDVANIGRVRQRAQPDRHCLRDQERRPPRRSQAQKNDGVEDVDAAYMPE
jgi:hypothetical protein